MKTYVSISMAILTASLVAPEVFGQHAQADLDGMPIFPGKKGVDRVPGPNVPIHNDSHLGLEARDIAADRARKLGLNKTRGVEVTQVVAGSPAAKAGFKSGDIVLDFNGRAVESEGQLSHLVSETPAGHQVKMGVWRAGARLTLTPTVETFDDPEFWPTLIKKVEPQLTPQAQKAGIEGKVVLRVEIGVDGRVYRGRVVEGLGHGLDAKAMDAVAQWRFSPGSKNGVAVVTPVTIQVWFRRQQ